MSLPQSLSLPQSFSIKPFPSWVFQRNVSIVAAVAVLAVFSTADAQSTSRNQIRSQAAPLATGSTQKSPQAVEVGLSGYCPVCIVEMRKWVKGSPEYQAVYDGKAYYFPSDKQKQMFLANPVKFAPALGGDCTVCLAKMGKRVPGSVQFSAIRNHRLFLFPSEDQKKEFVSNAGSYAEVDLAMKGQCVVCKVEMGNDVPGKPEFSTVHQGKRYQFPAAKQQQMFLANPAKYMTAK